MARQHDHQTFTGDRSEPHFLPPAIVPGAAALALGLSLTACGAGNEDDSSASGDRRGRAACPAPSTAAARSSQEAAQNAWRAGFQEANPDVTVNYDPIGSGGGREQFISGGFPFAGSDSYLTDDEGELDRRDRALRRRAPSRSPTTSRRSRSSTTSRASTTLNLSPDTLAGIFAGEITTWDDPAIAEDNPDADLPAEPITPVHRSDESGTTGNFTNYLSTVGRGRLDRTARSRTWPIEGGEGGNGTSGVVAAVTNGANTHRLRRRQPGR